MRRPVWALFFEVEERLERLDLLFNSAGTGAPGMTDGSAAGVVRASG